MGFTGMQHKFVKNALRENVDSGKLHSVGYNTPVRESLTLLHERNEGSRFLELIAKLVKNSQNILFLFP